MDLLKNCVKNETNVSWQIDFKISTNKVSKGEKINLKESNTIVGNEAKLYKAFSNFFSNVVIWEKYQTFINLSQNAKAQMTISTN